MKIILVSPYFNSHIIIPPLGLGYLSAYLKKRYAETEISIIDCLCDNIKNKRLTEIIEENQPDLVGLTTYSMFYEEVKDAIKRVKEMNSKISIVIGGPHVSALPVFSLEDTNADFAVFGEGEETLAQLVGQLRVGNDFSEIKGLCYCTRVQTTRIHPTE